MGRLTKQLIQLGRHLTSKGHQQEASWIRTILAQQSPNNLQTVLEWWEANPQASINEVYKRWQKLNQQQNVQTHFQQEAEVLQTLQERAPEIEEYKRLQEDWDQQLQNTEEDEKWLRRLVHERKIPEMPKDIRIFPKNVSLREYFAPKRPRGTTQEFWGKKDESGQPHIEKSLNIVEAIKQHGPIIPIKGWPLGYIGLLYDYQGVPSVVLQNVSPLRQGKGQQDIDYVGSGYATYVIPQTVDGEPWWDFLKERGREETTKMVAAKKEAGERGWDRMNRGSTEQINLLLDVLRYWKGE